MGRRHFRPPVPQPHHWEPCLGIGSPEVKGVGGILKVVGIEYLTDSLHSSLPHHLGRKVHQVHHDQKSKQKCGHLVHCRVREIHTKLNTSLIIKHTCNLVNTCHGVLKICKSDQ